MEPIPDPALVVLIGPSGSGKSTWAEKNFRAEEVISSDRMRAIVGSVPAPTHLQFLIRWSQPDSSAGC